MDAIARTVNQAFVDRLSSLEDMIISKGQGEVPANSVEEEVGGRQL
jgi:hypothetical protein